MPLCGAHLERETHLHIRDGEGRARQELRSAERALRCTRGACGPRRPRAQHRLRRLADAVEINLHQQLHHQRAFGVVNPIAAGLVLARAARRDETARAVALDQVLDDRARLREHEVAVLDDRRAAERMDLLELRRRKHGLRIALVAHDGVRGAELFQHPQHTLRAGVVEMVDFDHDELPPDSSSTPARSRAISNTTPVMSNATARYALSARVVPYTFCNVANITGAMPPPTMPASV